MKKAVKNGTAKNDYRPTKGKHLQVVLEIANSGASAQKNELVTLLVDGVRKSNGKTQLRSLMMLAYAIKRTRSFELILLTFNKLESPTDGKKDEEFKDLLTTYFEMMKNKLQLLNKIWTTPSDLDHEKFIMALSNDEKLWYFKGFSTLLSLLGKLEPLIRGAANRKTQPLIETFLKHTEEELAWALPIVEELKDILFCQAREFEQKDLTDFRKNIEKYKATLKELKKLRELLPHKADFNICKIPGGFRDELRLIHEENLKVASGGEPRAAQVEPPMPPVSLQRPEIPPPQQDLFSLLEMNSANKQESPLDFPESKPVEWEAAPTILLQRPEVPPPPQDFLSLLMQSPEGASNPSVFPENRPVEQEKAPAVPQQAELRSYPQQNMLSLLDLGPPSNSEGGLSFPEFPRNSINFDNKIRQDQRALKAEENCKLINEQAKIHHPEQPLQPGQLPLLQPEPNIAQPFQNCPLPQLQQPGLPMQFATGLPPQHYFNSGPPQQFPMQPGQQFTQPNHFATGNVISMPSVPPNNQHYPGPPFPSNMYQPFT